MLLERLQALEVEGRLEGEEAKVCGVGDAHTQTAPHGPATCREQ